mgnify:CR=1 FL=1|tara:strand:- start:104 stop:745 length:642 start_codon:yes stop_codon:yes gene_type:complete
MKVKIKKDGKVKQFRLIKKWSDVTLDKYIKLVNHHSGTKSSEALKAISTLSDIPKELIKQLELKDVAVIMNKLSDIQKQENSSLIRVVEIEGKRYGFHPNLDSITLGEWADIETLIDNNIENNLPELMAILYRPIIEEKNNVYTIEAYDGDISIRAEEMKKMKAEQVQSALVFFYHLGKKWLMILESYSAELLMEMKRQLQHKALQKNGDTLG